MSNYTPYFQSDATDGDKRGYTFAISTPAGLVLISLYLQTLSNDEQQLVVAGQNNDVAMTLDVAGENSDMEVRLDGDNVTVRMATCQFSATWLRQLGAARENGSLHLAFTETGPDGTPETLTESTMGFAEIMAIYAGSDA